MLAFERSAGRPGFPPEAADFRDLIKACPPKGAAHPCRVHPQQQQSKSPKIPVNDNLDKHRSIDRHVPEKNDKVDPAIFPAVSDMQLSA